MSSFKRAGVGLVLGLLALPGCRDATLPADLEDRPGGEELPRQLTFSTEDDRAPAWGPDGDRIWYATPGIPPYPGMPGLLLSVPVEGGAAAPIVPELQLRDTRASIAGGTRYTWFAAATPEPSGTRMAYVDLTFVWPQELCLFVREIQCTPATDPSVPRLRDATLRLRDLEARPPVSEEPALELTFEGRVFVPPPPFTTPPPQGIFEVTHHPYQQLFSVERSMIFRPSWSPDGGEVVFSDGLRLLRWDGVDDPSPVPGTDDGVLASWSPDGDWIAFTRLGRGAMITATCNHFGGRTSALIEQCRQEPRTAWPLTGRTIVLVRPDGSEVRDLWEGDEPAWTPDGESVVFRQGGRLRAGPVDGGAPEPIPDTQGGREPAVSPDGTLLAFTRPGSAGSFDVWVVELPPVP